MDLKLIRNATLRLRYGGIDWLIDPMLGTRNSIRSLGESAQRNPTVELPCPVTEVLAGVDVVVVSHNHPDHFDAAAEGLVPRHLRLRVVRALHVARNRQRIWTADASSARAARQLL